MSLILDLGKEQMNEAIAAYETRLGTLRTGRAHAGMLYGIHIDYYGSPTPIEQIAQISVLEGRQLSVKLFDPSVLKEVEKAINSSNLGLLAQNDGSKIYINVPSLTEETRREVSKSVNVFAEEAKIVIRNIRRELNDEVKHDDSLPEDQEKKALEDVQKLTDESIKRIDTIAKDKIKDVMTV